MNRLARFLHKPPREQAAAALATLKHALRPGFARRPDQRIAGRRLAVPQTFRRRAPFYLALRPDADIIYDKFSELSLLAEAWVRGNPVPNAGDLPRLYGLTLNIRAMLAEGVQGDFAELGVYRGNSAAVLAYYARRNGRRLFLFDTFAGFDERDLIGADHSKPRAFADTSLAAVRELVGDQGVAYIQGRFPESYPAELADAQFSMVHLDCDLYDPIRTGMEVFFPRLAPGGLLVVHDYGNPCWEGVARAVDEFLRPRSERPVIIPDKCGTAVIRKAMPASG